MTVGIETVVLGALFGLLSSAIGYIKNASQYEDESFDFKKAAPTVILTTLAGGYMAFQGMPLNDVSLASAVTGLTAVGAADIINNIWKAICNKLGF